MIWIQLRTSLRWWPKLFPSKHLYLVKVNIVKVVAYFGFLCTQHNDNKTSSMMADYFVNDYKKDRKETGNTFEDKSIFRFWK